MVSKFLGAVVAGCAGLTTVVGVSAQSAAAKAMIAEVVRTGSVIVRASTFDPRADGAGRILGPGARSSLRAVLTERDEWTFEVQVHTDETGAADTDLRLTTSRAQAIVALAGLARHRAGPAGGRGPRPHPSAADRPGRRPDAQHRRLEPGS